MPGARTQFEDDDAGDSCGSSESVQSKPGDFSSPGDECADDDVAAEARGLETRAVHGGREVDPATGAIVAALVCATTYVQEGLGGSKGHTYSRASNPTVSALERALGAVENAPAAAAFSSGMAAITTLLLATLKAGDEVLVSEVVYGGTVRLLEQVLSEFGITARYLDTSEGKTLAAAVSPATRLILLETPANPTLRLADIAGAAAVAKRAGAILAVDNTFLTGVLQRPLDLGADVVIYSTTKHIEGHNAAVGGALLSRDEQLLDRLRFVRKTLGTIQSPFAAWLTLRGVKTLPVRIREHSRNAQRVATWLEEHPRVKRVHYPGLASFAQAALAKKQHRDAGSGESLHGGVLSFEVEGRREDAVRVMNRLSQCRLAESLGAVETLVTHPATMTHGDVPKEQRARTGIADGLIRVSVGLEDPEDIIADLERALRTGGESGGKGTPCEEAVAVAAGGAR